MKEGIFDDQYNSEKWLQTKNSFLEFLHKSGIQDWEEWVREYFALETQKRQQVRM